MSHFLHTLSHLPWWLAILLVWAALDSLILIALWLLARRAERDDEDDLWPPDWV